MIARRQKRSVRISATDELARLVLAEARRSAHVTQRQLAGRLGKGSGAAYVRGIEDGTRRLTRLAFVRIARALDPRHGTSKLFRRWRQRCESEHAAEQIDSDLHRGARLQQQAAVRRHGDQGARHARRTRQSKRTGAR